MSTGAPTYTNCGNQSAIDQCLVDNEGADGKQAKEEEKIAMTNSFFLKK